MVKTGLREVSGSLKHHPDIYAANAPHRLFVERKQVLPVVADGFRGARRLSRWQEAEQ